MVYLFKEEYIREAHKVGFGFRISAGFQCEAGCALNGVLHWYATRAVVAYNVQRCARVPKHRTQRATCRETCAHAARAADRAGGDWQQVKKRNIIQTEYTFEC
jgi:hypothetical protein